MRNLCLIDSEILKTLGLLDLKGHLNLLPSTYWSRTSAPIGRRFGGNWKRFSFSDESKPSVLMTLCLIFPSLRSLLFSGFDRFEFRDVHAVEPGFH